MDNYTTLYFIYSFQIGIFRVEKVPQNRTSAIAVIAPLMIPRFHKR